MKQVCDVKLIYESRACAFNDRIISLNEKLVESDQNPVQEDRNWRSHVTAVGDLLTLPKLSLDFFS